MFNMLSWHSLNQFLCNLLSTNTSPAQHAPHIRGIKYNPMWLNIYRIRIFLYPILPYRMYIQYFIEWICCKNRRESQPIVFLNITLSLPFVRALAWIDINNASIINQWKFIWANERRKKNESMQRRYEKKISERKNSSLAKTKRK